MTPKGTIHVYTGDPNKRYARLAPKHITRQLNSIAEWIIVVSNARNDVDLDQRVQQAFLERGRFYSKLFSGNDCVYVFRYSLKE